VPIETRMWCEVKQAVREGQPYREVLSYADEQNVDLICMGASGTGFGMRALFGSNADRVLRQAPCPVLIARPLRPAIAAITA
jgi:nucleotide-binding universal stress UspA family protein